MMRRRARRLTIGFLALAALVTTACGRSQPPAGADSSDKGPRIVSLTPAITQMIVDLGLGDRLVGIAQYDAAAPEGPPVVGIYTEVDTEKLLSVNPTHVLLMTGKDGPPAALTEMADAGRFTLAWYPYTNTAADVAEVLADVGAVLGRPDEADALRDRMINDLKAVADRTEGLNKPRVLMVFALSPVMASGGGTVLDAMLTRAGGVNAAAASATTAPTYDREALIALQPDVILLLKPGDPPLREHDERLAGFDGLPIPAVEHGRIVLLNDPLVLLPSTNLPRVAEQMRQAIHDHGEAAER